MNGYQLTKQYFAFAAANPGATTPGMCALFMWLVEVNNRSRFTQNFFFNAEDAGYACGMQSRKTVWKYLVQLESAGLVQVVYKSNNQERPSVLSFWVSGDELRVTGGSVAGSSVASCGMPVTGDYLAGRSVASDELPAAGTSVTGDELLAVYNSDACHPDAQYKISALGSDTADGGLQTAENTAIGHPVESAASSGVRSNWRFYGARRISENLPADGALCDDVAGFTVRANAAIDDLQGQEYVDAKRSLSVSKDTIVGAKSKSAASKKSAAKASRQQQIKVQKNQSACGGLPATEHPAPRNPKPAANTLANRNQKLAAFTPATDNPSLATQHSATRTPKPAAITPATRNRIPRNQNTGNPTPRNTQPKHPQPAALPPKHRLHTASPALAHSYKGLNYPNNKNSVNGAHLGFEVMQQPDLTEVSTFFTQHGYTANAAEKAWAHYRQANWHDVQGRPVLNWQQKCRTIWFTPENRIPTTQSRFVQ